MQLRDYQQKLIDELFEKEKTHKRVAVCAATGSGKSACLSYICQKEADRGKKVLVLAHRNLLIDQLAETLGRFGITCGYIKAGYNYDSNKQVYVSSVQTLSRRKLEHKFDRIIFDEAHITTMSAVSQRLLEENPNTYFNGFTATPFPSTKRKNISRFYTAEVVAPTPNELMSMGFLAKDDYFVFPTYRQTEIDNLKVNTYGEYDAAALGKMCLKPKSIENVVREHIRLAGKRQTVVFAAGVEHSKALESEFIEKGISAKHIDGTTKKSERDKIYKSFRKGDLSVLINCAILTEGADFPKIECVVLACPYRSKARYVQAVGRGLRIADNKELCLILDHGQNATRLGTISSLNIDDYRLQTYKKPNGEAPTKVCPQCHKLNHLSATECVNCGYKFPIVAKDDVEALVGELVHIGSHIAAPIVSLEEMQKYYQSMVRSAFYGRRSAGMPLAAWSSKYKDQKVQDMSAITLHALFGPHPADYQIKKFGNWVMDYVVKKGYTVETFRAHCLREFGDMCYNNESVQLTLRQIWRDRRDELTQNSSQDS